MKEAKETNVVIYVRVSKNKAEYERQLRELRTYCAKNKWNQSAIFKEKVSGKKSNAERIEFEKALSFVKNNKVDKFLVWEWSRIGRSSIVIQQNVAYLHKYCCSLHIMTLAWETLNDKCEESMEGKIIVSLLSVMAEIEVDNISKRLNSGRDNYVKNGGKLGRTKGYKKPIKETKNYKVIVDMLKLGNKLNQIMKASEVSANTIRKVRTELEKEGIIEKKVKKAKTIS